VDPGPLGRYAEPGSRKFGSRGGSREPARRSNAFRGAAIVDVAAARGVEVVAHIDRSTLEAHLASSSVARPRSRSPSAPSCSGMRVARCCVLWPAVFTDPMVGGGTSMAGAREMGIESGFNILARGRPRFRPLGLLRRFDSGAYRKGGCGGALWECRFAQREAAQSGSSIGRCQERQTLSCVPPPRLVAHHLSYRARPGGARQAQLAPCL
jgi:hypothetical protein